MHATTVAIDLAKEVFELAFANTSGQVLERKRLSRKAFTGVLDNQGPLRVLMEACGSAHYWGRRFAAQGHAVKLGGATGKDCRPGAGNGSDRGSPAGVRTARCHHATLPAGAWHRPDDRNRAPGQRRITGPLPQRPPSFSVAGPGAARTQLGYAPAPGPDHPARRHLLAHLADPRCTRRAASGAHETATRAGVGSIAGLG